MSTNLNYKQVANVKRRTWDVEAYEKKAKERAAQQDANTSSSAPPNRRGRSDDKEEEENAPKRFKLDENDDSKEEFRPAEKGAAGPEGSKRAFLQARTGKVDIDSKVGETEIISAEAAAKSSLNDDGSLKKGDGVTKSGVGWHCSVCDCFLKDSMTYLDHINGRKHQRKLGYSMRVERSTKDQMMGRLSQLAKEKERAEEKSTTKQFVETNYQEVVQKRDEDEAEKKAERARRRKEKKKAKKAAMQSPPPLPPKEEAADEEEEGEEKVEEEEINPDLAAMMGFSGFGGGK